MGEFDDWDEFGPPEIRPVPPGHPRLRVALIAGGLVLAILVAAGGVFALSRRGSQPPATPTPPKPRAADVTESFTVTETPGASGTIVPTATTSSTATTTSPSGQASQAFTRAAKVAYRKDGALWVADETGTGAQRVVTSASGAFALSPDGRTLAIVDGVTKQLTLAVVANSTVTTIGAAEVEAPTWSPSSAWLAYLSGGVVRRVGRDGKAASAIASGTAVSIGPDDETAAVASGNRLVLVRSGGSATTVLSAKGVIDDVALGKDRVYYAVGGASQSALSVRSAGLDGSDDRELTGPPTDAEAGQYEGLALSPDGAWLTYAAIGDTLHSRLRAMHADGTSDTELSLRHDDYFLRWSADGKRILFIDGNVLQGDTPQLMSVRPDGTMRLTLLAGAGE